MKVKDGWVRDCQTKEMGKRRLCRADVERDIASANVRDLLCCGKLVDVRQI